MHDLQAISDDLGQPRSALGGRAPHGQSRSFGRHSSKTIVTFVEAFAVVAVCLRERCIIRCRYGFFDLASSVDFLNVFSFCMVDILDVYSCGVAWFSTFDGSVFYVFRLYKGGEVSSALFR